MDSLHERDHLIAGAVFTLIFAAATAAQLALNGLTPRAALKVGLPLVLDIGLVEIALDRLAARRSLAASGLEAA